MKKLLCAILSLCLGAIAFGANLETTPESKLWLVGDSTLHAYSSQATLLHVQAEIETGAMAFDQIRSGKMSSLFVRVPVSGLKSEKAQLDKNLRKALKAAENPDVTFRMSGYSVRSSTSTGQFIVDAKGDLTVAGVTKPISVDALVFAGDPVRIQGHEEVFMTDHGIKPPSFMGAIRTHDRVVINFDLFLK